MKADKKIFGKYIELLGKWREKINLVGPGTMDEAWERHFEDSLSLYEFVAGYGGSGGKDAEAGNNAASPSGGIFDIGSGAGFPGMVLAVSGIGGITLVEVDGRKCEFLNEVRRAYGCGVGIINERVEKLHIGDGIVPNGGAGCITGRAFAPLDRFLGLCGGLIGPKSAMYLLKGEQVGDEIENARKDWDFEYSLHNKKGGYILEIRNIKRENC